MIENHRIMTIFESYFHIKLRKNLKNHSGADFNLMKNQFFSNSYFKDFIRIFYDLVRYHPKSILLRHICVYISLHTLLHTRRFLEYLRGELLSACLGLKNIFHYMELQCSYLSRICMVTI